MKAKYAVLRECKTFTFCLEQNISAAFMECVVKSIFSLLQVFLLLTLGAFENASAVGMHAFATFSFTVRVFASFLFYYISISKDTDILKPRDKLSVGV
jgi:hypothetical protein